MKDFKTIFFFLRLPIAISLAGHGLVRLPKLQTFTEGMVKSMEKSAIPEALIMPFGYVLPFLEAIIGISLLIGFKPKLTIYSAFALMSILILGSSSVENWSAIEAQLLHSLYLFALLWFYLKYSSEENQPLI
ncbi:MauE/DoxX family redox-associated membrane protein [Chryseobacterium indoltheticum]|jgi:thiosulfate dehydrogenase [quinone] large subunit|uniref:MauE/DoxX family redox-associated membrane protein n=1 Tax=Chryseobacterium indoltheticum TaxID=254 RepID=UPI00242E3A0B|nr:MauE/DoxX family redox-associated membrane protein [Chryseobacterium indoltheticum]MDF2832822.1 DoxX family protein [Chryseobacterium indoltheticum]